MNIFKKYIANLLGLILILLFKRSAIKQVEMQVLSIYFHNPPFLLFKGIIQFLVKRGFRFISEDEYYSILKGEKEQESRLVFVSFDDGWRGNLKLIPILEKYQIPATFFIPVKPVISGNYWWEYAPFILENTTYSSVDDLKQLPNHERIQLIQQMELHYELERSCITLNELKRIHENPLFTIGSHTYHHPITVKCSKEELEFEYRESKETLEEWLISDIKSFSYPNGDFDQRDLEQLDKNGYKMAFTVEPDLSSKYVSFFRIPRVSINSKGGKYENIARMLRIWHRFVQPLQNTGSRVFIFKPKLTSN